MGEGERCICQYDDWYNAFGEKSDALSRGMRLTVIGTQRVGGMTFYSFAEAPEGSFYLGTGFVPMRNLQ